MKRLASVLCAATMVAMLAGCGGGGQEGLQAKAGAADTPQNSLEEIIQRAQTDFSDTGANLIAEQEAMFSEVGDTYEDYLANVDTIQAWYDLSVSETEALGERAIEYGREYYQAVVDNVDVSDDRSVDKAVEEFYDAIYEDAFEDYYDLVYEDAFDDMYDAYYDGVIDDAYDVTPYDEWSDAHGDAYDAWSDAHSDVYDAWSDSRSDVYSDYSDVRSAFYSNDFDVEGIFAPVEVKENNDLGTDPDESDSSADSVAAGETSDTSGIDPDFKATMDSYEEFFDEYAEFMEAYSDNPSSPELMAQYADMLEQYSETMAEMSGIDTGSLSAADAAYYSEVLARIYERLAEVG